MSQDAGDRTAPRADHRGREVSAPRNGSTVALKEYADRRIDDLSQHLEAKFATLEVQIGSTKADLAARLEGMNEIRQQLNMQATTFVTLSTFEAKLEGIAQRLDNLSTRMDGLLGPLANRVGELEKKRSASEGQGRTLGALSAAAVGVIGTLIIGLGALIVRILLTAKP
jgi:hypothetical protein